MNRRFVTFLLLALTSLSCDRERLFSTHSPEALAFYEQGVQLQMQFFYKEALAKLDSAIAVDSTFAMAWGRLAALNMELRDEEKAGQLIATAKRHAVEVTEREQLYIRLWDRMINFEYRRAAGIADSLIVLFPSESEPYLLKGHLYERMAQLDSAIYFYRKSAAIDTANTRAVMSLGYAYSAAGDQNRAIEYMQRYLRLAPGLPDPHASFADLLLRVGRYDEALEQYNRSLEYKPDYWYSLNQIGYIHGLLGRLREAEEYYRQGFSFLPGNPTTVSAIPTIVGDFEMRRGNYKKATESFLEALSKDSLSYEAAYGLVIALSKQKKFAEADEVAQRIGYELERRQLNGSPQMVGYHLMLARILVEKQRYQAAREECDSALLVASPLARTAVFRQLADISYHLRQIERGFLECEESLSINPNSPSTLLILARLYNAKGDRRMTAEIGRRLLDLWK
ncbi:MAG: tetratricopeptide repeat protein, partial [Ignavibacteria bacterium]|nr:tetratricopeptide repeat protein [Ignavibacteria bacterium]